MNIRETIPTEVHNRCDLKITHCVRTLLDSQPRTTPDDVVVWLRNAGAEISLTAAGVMLAAIKAG